MPRGRAAVLAAASGVVLAFAYPEPDLAPLAWIALVPLLVLTAGVSAGAALVVGMCYGVGFFGALLVWISLVGWAAWALLVTLQAAFVALFAVLWSPAAARLRPAGRIVAAPVLWVAVEYVRANVPLGGFTWGQLAQSQHDLVWLLRLAAFGGGWLVSFVVVAVNASLAETLRAWVAGRRRAIVAYAGVAVVCLSAPLALPSPSARTGEPVRVAVVQGNVPRAFSGPLFDKEMAIIRSHAMLTRRLADRTGSDAAPPDLVVWPESSVGLDIERTAEAGAAVTGAARAVDAPLIVGGNLDVDPERYRVVALQVSASGRIVDRYHKTHLVPFGEYVPARAALGWIPMLDQVPRDAVAGDDPVVFDVAGGPVAPVISYEGDFGSLVRARIEAGGRLLVVATNTSTWGTSWASAQHVAFSQLRAVENGVWVVHAALSGISAIVTPEGRVVADTPLWTATTLARTMRFADDVTLYARVGDWVPLSCVAAVALAGAVVGLRRAYRVS